MFEGPPSNLGWWALAEAKHPQHLRCPSRDMSHNANVSRVPPTLQILVCRGHEIEKYLERKRGIERVAEGLAEGMLRAMKPRRWY